MEKTTATITFHGSDFFTFDPQGGHTSKYDQMDYSESDNTCSFRVPVSENVTKRRSIQDTLEYFSVHLTRPAVPLVNGTPQDMSYILQPGDCVIMLFQISGG